MPIQGIVSPLPPVLTLNADYATNKTLVSATGPDVILSRASTGYYMNASGVWASAAIDTARFHHYYINGQIVSGGLLKEPERTNLLLYTSALNNAAWNAGGLTATSVAAAAPDGGAAWRLTTSNDGSATFHRIYQTINTTSGQPYTSTIYVKADTCKILVYNVNAVIGETIYFNLEEETIAGNVAAAKKSMTRLPNSWYKLEVTVVADATSTANVQWWTAGPISAGGVSVDYQASGESLLVWAPQTEIGLSGTTPIFSGASAATRSADLITVSSNDFDAIHSDSGGILVVGTRCSAKDTDIEYARIDDLSDQNSITCGRNSSGDFFAKVRSNDSNQLSATIDYIYNELEPVTSGVMFKTNKAIGGIKGVLTSPSTTVTPPVNPSRLVLGGTTFNGCIASVKVYDAAYRSYTDFQSLLGAYVFVEPDTLNTLSSNCYTDVQSKTITAAYAKLQRSHVDASNYYRAAPGARVRVQTTVTDIKFLFEVDSPQPDSYQGVFSVLVDGAEMDQYILLSGSSGEFTIEVLGTGNRLVEVILPMGASVRFKGLQRYGSGNITAPAARPTKTIACFGDSITNGYFASRVTKSWPFLLGQLESAEVINVGYGSEVSGVSGLGTEAGNIGAEHTFYCIGYNDFGAQVALATYKSNVQAFVDAFRAVNATGKLYLGGPFYTPNTNTLTPANYRTQISDIVTSEADANTILLNTLGASSNNAAAFPDTIHPSNSASLEIATAFSGVVA